MTAGGGVRIGRGITSNIVSAKPGAISTMNIVPGAIVPANLLIGAPGVDAVSLHIGMVLLHQVAAVLARALAREQVQAVCPVDRMVEPPQPEHRD